MPQFTRVGRNTIIKWVANTFPADFRRLKNTPMHRGRRRFSRTCLRDQRDFQSACMCGKKVLRRMRDALGNKKQSSNTHQNLEANLQSLKRSLKNNRVDASMSVSKLAAMTGISITRKP